MGPHPIGRGRALALAGLVAGVLALAVYGAVAVSSRQWRVQRTFLVRSEFASIGGIAAGDRVRLQGMDAGVVEAVVPPREPGRPVGLVLRVDERLRGLVRRDATAKIVTEGVVGARVVELVPGKPDAPPLGPDGRVAGVPTTELGDLVARAARSLERLDTVTAAAADGLEEVQAVVASVRKGEGSLGKLVRDDEVYDRLVAVSEKGERTLRDLDENLDALKQTWPLSRYFDRRAYIDRERVLYHPGSERDTRTIAADDLFEPGRSVLTAGGRQQLDAVGAWFRSVKRPASEVVIAAFTDRPADPQLAQILTQEQAEAVKTYLASRFKIHSSGWFASRKVAAVGFGTEVPPADAAGAAPRPARRVEIILFTPQA